MNEPEKPKGATPAELAALFDCSTRQIELWAKDQIVVRVARGRYDVVASTTGVVKHLREQAAGRAGIDRDTDVMSAGKELKEQQTRIVRIKADQLAGDLVAVEEVRETWARIVRAARQFVLGLPGKIAFEVPTVTATDRMTIETICRDGLEDLSLDRGSRVGG